MIKKLLVILFLFNTLLYSEVLKKDIAVGLNFPGIGVRYFLSNKTSIELKGQYETNILVGGLRGYYYFFPQEKYLLFAGLEGDFVSFKGDVSEGTGIAGELFIGGEYFFAKSFSVQLDLGPAFVALKDKDTSESLGGLEYVANFGINYYFGKGGR